MNYKEIRGGIGPNGRTKILQINRRLAVKYYCSECVGWNQTEVKKCTEEGQCSLYPFRLGEQPSTYKERAQAIRDFCINCCCGDTEYLVECPTKLCALHPYRLADRRTDKDSFCEGPSDTVL